MPHAETPESLTPAIFVSHGSPHMCSKESDSTRWWGEFGKQAKAHHVKGIVFVGAHWEELDDRIRVATKLNPKKLQMDMVDKKYWEDYPLNVSTDLAHRVISLLREHNFTDVEADPEFDWHDDAVIPSRWMFPEGTPPTTIVSMNARFNPVFHLKIGRALGQLRKEGILLCGTGGAVHNLYRNNWYPMLTKSDNFQVGRTPAKWATEFEQAVNDVVSKNAGPQLAGALTRLVKHPYYKDAHPTDDHFYPLLVIGGAVSAENVYGKRMAQTWELQNMCNDQFVWGSWG